MGESKRKGGAPSVQETRLLRRKALKERQARRRPMPECLGGQKSVDSLARTQSLSLREKQEGGKDRDAEGCPECHPWVCCMTLGKLPNLSEPVSSSVK